MGVLILIRHGQSIWNLQNRFTGWADVSLSKKGLIEARRAALKLKHIKFNAAFTSRLLRAQETLYEILNRNLYCHHYIRVHEEESNWYSHYAKNQKQGKIDIPIFCSEKLNERYYGDLQGLNKDEVRKKYGEEQVHIWRRSYTTPPPGGNPLKVTYERTIPYYKKAIQSRLKKGETIIIAAHGNSLRSIIKYIENISDEDITSVELDTGVPIKYTFDLKMKLIKKEIL